MSADVENKLRVLREQYARHLPSKIDTLAAKWQSLCARPDETDLAQNLVREFHTLAGSGTSFGFPEISRLARLAEEELRQADPATWAHAPLRRTIDDLLTALAAAARTSADIPATDAQAVSVITSRRVHLLVNDSAIRDTLETQLTLYGYEPHSFATPEAMFAANETGAPCAMVVDADDCNAAGRYRHRLQRQAGSEVPLLVIAGAGDMEHRLQAVRAGAAAFFIRPPDPHAFIDTLDKLVRIRQQDPYRILIIDDDADTAELYAGTLEQAGMHTQVVSRPLAALDHLHEFNPELVLLDLHMPECHGTELAAVIRQLDAHVSTPIVFLSSERDIGEQLAAIRLGGDDFLVKPISGAHLVSAVQSRAARHRLLRSFMVRDSLTGLYNHASTREMLQRELARARRNGTPLSFAMLDIDHFKQVNDTHGHGVGDEVIKLLARTLRQRLRATDIVGRYGGEEFAVILPDTGSNDARMVIDALRESFHGRELPGQDGNAFHASFSAGIASFPDYDTDYQIGEQADRALYAAKQAGRNRVRVASE